MPSPILPTLPELAPYDLEDLLGEDPFGWSYLARTGASEHRVVKVLKSQATEDRFLEYCVARLANSSPPVPGAAEILDFRPGTEGRSALCVTPFYGWAGKDTRRMQPTSLKRLMRHIPRGQAPEIVAEIARCLAGVHAAGMFHGGVKPSSLYLGSDERGGRTLRLGGFGQIFMGGLQYLGVGDLLFYASPEQIATGDFSDEAGPRWDTYAFGVVAFQLLTGHFPRLDRLHRQFLENERALRSAAAIAYGELTPVTEHFIKQLHAEISVEWPDETADERERALRRLVEGCLSHDAGRRPASMVEVSARLDEIHGASERPVPEPPADATAVGAPIVGAAKRSVSGTAAPAIYPARAEVPVAEVRREEASGDRAGLDAATAPAASPVAAGPDPSDRADEAAQTRLGAAASESGEESLRSPGKEEERLSLGEKLAAEAAPPPQAPPPPAIQRPPFAARAVLKWQLAAVASMAAMLPLSFFAVQQHLQLREARKEFSEESAHLAATLRKQAETRRRLENQKEETTKQLTAELNDLEDSRSELLGEAMLARQVVRRTQSAGDEFFRLVLENRDTDVPEFRTRRGALLLKARDHYEGLVEVYGDAADFLASTANAFFYLGRIYREQGEFGKSLASFGEAERRYLALAEDDPEGSAEYVKNIAIAKGALGELSLIDAQYAIARHYFTESSRYWSEARSLDPGETPEAANRIHANSLAIAECEFAIGRVDAALDGARSVGSRLLALQEEEPENDRVIGALARSFGIVGRILEARGASDLAKEAYEQAGNLYARALILNAAVDAYHLGLGHALARVGLIENDIGKLEKSMEVLKKVVAQNPYEAEYQRTLADVYGVLSRDQRDGGRGENAAKLEHEAIAILQPIIRANPEAVPPDVLYSYAQRLAHLAELLGDSGDFQGSRAPLREAIVVLERISAKDGSLAQYRRALARARGLAGFACLKSGDRNEAREHLELAKSEWETYMAGNPEDADAEQAVRWTSDQLRALR